MGIPSSGLIWKGCAELSLLLCLGWTGGPPLSLPVLALSLLELRDMYSMASSSMRWARLAMLAALALLLKDRRCRASWPSPSGPCSGKIPEDLRCAMLSG